MNHLSFKTLAQKLRVGAGIGLALAALLTGCASAAAPAPAATKPPADKVTVQLSWTHSSEFAAFYMAKDKNYYADEGLDVDLLPSGYDAAGNYIDPVKQVTSGKADFGLLEGMNVLAARDAGTPIVAIATNYKRHPVAFTSLAEKKIARPQDLVGKKVAVSPNSVYILQALLKSQNIDPKLVNSFERTDFTTASLIKGDYDVIDAWVTNEVVSLTDEGHKINSIVASDYGIEAYPDVIFTTEDTIKKNPALVERFLRATLRGMTDAIATPDKAAQLSVAMNKDLVLKSETEAMQRSLPLLNSAGDKPGMMTDTTWAFMDKMANDQKLFKNPVDVKAAYTLTFLNKVYSQ